MSTQQNGSSGSADELEAVIEKRRAHLAATVDELLVRAQPQAIASRSLAGVKQRVTTATHTEDGALRTDRLAAAGAAIAGVITVFALIRRASNRRRRRRDARRSGE